MNIDEILFSLIRNEICEKEIPSNYKEYITSDTLIELHSLTSKHDIFSIIASAISNNGFEIDSDNLNLINKELIKSVYRYERINHDFLSICQIFEKSMIKYIPLKGAVIREFYSKPWLRTSCDIDILVQKEDIDSSINALCNCGYVRIDDTSTYDYTLKSPGGVHVELHFALTTGGVFPEADVILESVWQTVEPDEKVPYRYNMNNEMLIYYHIVHMAKHFVNGGCGIRPFIDFWILKKNLSINKIGITKLLQESNLLTFYKSVLDLTNVWFDEALHNDITQQMQDFIINGGVYGSISNLAKVNAAKGVSKARSFINLMFLTRESLEVLYPYLKKHPNLFAYYQIKRWFKIFKKDSRNLIENMTTERNSVSESDKVLTNKFLNNLGLLK